MATTPVYFFPPYRLIPARRQLLRAEQPIKLGGRAFDMLVALIERRDSVIDKHDLMSLVWPRVVVEENNLQVQISALRKLLGHEAIATVPGRGYRFTLPVGVEGNGPVEGEDRATVLETVTTHGRVPRWLPPLIGREHDLEAIVEALEAHPLVTVVGPAGIGKTRLAQTAARQCAARHQAPFWWVDLAPVADPRMVAAAFATTLGLQLEGHRNAAAAVTTALAGRGASFLVDNAEHMLSELAGLITEIRCAAPDLRLLVTSQEALHVADEHVFRLDPLALPASDALEDVANSGAAALFVARAQGSHRRFSLGAENCAAVADICRRLDGMPLAIELAAVRVPMLGVEGLRTQLDDRLQVLTSGERTAPGRHQTLRKALEWSYQLLSLPEQAVLSRLGVFTGGFNLEAAQQVAEDGHSIDRWDVLEHLGGLVDKSLVVAEGDPLPRYRLLESTRLFALERLNESGEAPAARHAHREYFTAAADAAREQMLAAGAGGLPWFDLELYNLTAAIGWTQGDDAGAVGLRLAAATRYYWMSRGLLSRGLEIMLAALAHPDADAASPDKVTVMATAAQLAAMMGQLDDAIRHALCAVAMARSIQVDAVISQALAIAGGVYNRRGEFADADRCAEEALSLARRIGDSDELGAALSLAAQVKAYAGRHDLSRDLLLEGLALQQRMGHTLRQATEQLKLATLELSAARLDVALSHLHALLGLLRTVDSKLLGVELIGMTAWWTAQSGQATDAHRLQAAYIAHAQRIGMTVPLDSMSTPAEDAPNDSAHDSARAEGYALSYDDAIEAVRRVLSSAAGTDRAD